jgi:predicted S18 family serine protease
MKTNKLDWDVIYVPVQLEGNAMSEFQMVMLCIIGIATVSLVHSIYLMIKLNQLENKKTELDKTIQSLQRDKNFYCNKVTHFDNEHTINAIEQEIEGLQGTNYAKYIEIKKLINQR